MCHASVSKKILGKHDSDLFSRKVGRVALSELRLQHYQHHYGNYCHIVKELARFRNIRWAQKWTDAPAHKHTCTHTHMYHHQRSYLIDALSCYFANPVWVFWSY